MSLLFKNVRCILQAMRYVSRLSLVTVLTVLVFVASPAVAQNEEGDDPCDPGGIIDEFVGDQDCNQNGTPDWIDICQCDGSPNCQDTDGNGRPDGCDIWYCSVPRSCEECANQCDPGWCAQNPQFCHPCVTVPGCEEWCEDHPQDCSHCFDSPECLDCNENGILDEDETNPENPGFPGTDDDPYSQDCNNDGIPDICQLDEDSDNDGIPDVCEDPNCAGTRLCEDCDGDGFPDPPAIDCYVDCLDGSIGPCAPPPPPPGCPPCNPPFLAVHGGGRSCFITVDVRSCDGAAFEYAPVPGMTPNPICPVFFPLDCVPWSDEVPDVELGQPVLVFENEDECLRRYRIDVTGNVPGGFYVYWFNGPPPVGCPCCYGEPIEVCVLCDTPVLSSTIDWPSANNECRDPVVRARTCSPLPLEWQIEANGTGECTLNPPALCTLSILEEDAVQINGEWEHIARISGLDSCDNLPGGFCIRVADPRAREVDKWDPDGDCFAQRVYTIPCEKPRYFSARPVDDEGYVYLSAEHCFGVRWEIVDNGTNAPDIESLPDEAFLRRARMKYCGGEVKLRAYDARSPVGSSASACYAKLKIGDSECDEESGSAELGSARFRLGIGADARGRSLGYIEIDEAVPTPILGTPAALQFVWSSPEVEVIRQLDGSLRQIKSPQMLLDVLDSVPTVPGYVVEVYAAANAGDLGLSDPNDPDSLIVYHPIGAPHTRWAIDYPASDELLIVKSVGTQDILQHHFEYVGQNGEDEWNLTTQDLRSGLGVTQLSTMRWVTPTEKHVESWLDGSLVRKRVETFNVDRTALLSSTVDPEGANLTTVFTYYEPAAGKARRLRSVVEPTGRWQYLVYDAYGRVQFVYGPYGDGPTFDVFIPTGETEPPDAGIARVTEYQYSGDPFDHRPLATIERVPDSVNGGTITTRWTEYEYGETGELGQWNPYTRISQRIVPTSDCAAGPCLSTKAIYRNRGSVNLRADMRPLVIERPDGTRTSFTYAKGQFEFVTPPSGSTFTENGIGPDESVTVTEGTVTSPDGVALRTTRRMSVIGATGRSLMDRSFVCVSPGVFDEIGWSVTAVDARNRPVEIYRSDNTRQSYVWDDCCSTSETTDSSGIRRITERDALKRVRKETVEAASSNTLYATQPAIETILEYAVAVETGRFRQTRFEAPLTSPAPPPLESYEEYDSAGRLKRTQDAAGVWTEYLYSVDGRTETATHASGATTVTESMLDGRILRVSGTGTIPRYYEYGAYSNGQQWTKVYVGSTDNSSPRWSRTVVDALGRTVTDESPAVGGVGTIASVTTYFNDNNSPGRMGRIASVQVYQDATPARAATLFQYDSLGALVYSGLDLNGDGVLSLASTDRIQDGGVPTYEQFGSDWWVKTVQRVFPTDHSSTATTLAITRARLTGLASSSADGPIAAETRVLDYYGNETISTTAIDRTTKTVKQRVNHPATNNDSVSVTYNGRLVESIDKAQLKTMFGYDSLGRQTTVTDARGVTSGSTYNAAGQLETLIAPGNFVTTYSYDAAGRLASIENPDIKYTYYGYNLRGQVEKVWGEAVQPTWIEYDAFGARSMLHTWRDGSAFEAAGSTWPANAGDGDITTWLYDPSTGVVTQKVYDDGNAMTYGYYGTGEVAYRDWARQNNGAAVHTTYAYSMGATGTGALTGITYTDGTPAVTFNQYDRLGRPISITDAFGTRTLTYAANMTPNTEAFGGSSPLSGKQIRTLYQDNVTYTGPGSTIVKTDFLRLASVAVGTSSIPTQDYNATYDYDPNTDRLTQATGPGLPGYGANYTYLANSALLQKTSFKTSASVTIASATRAYESNRNLLASIENRWDSTNPAAYIVSRYAYEHDVLGRRSSIVRSGSAFALAGGADHLDLLAYNTRSELVDTERHLGTDPGAPGTAQPAFDRAYDYDAIGNRLTATDGDTSTRTYTANNLNQYARVMVDTPVAGQGLTYDEDGNLSETFVSSDVDGDGDVDNDDLNLLQANFGATCEQPGTLTPIEERFVRADADGDCVITLQDLAALASMLGTSDSAGRRDYAWDAENRLVRVEPPSPIDGDKRVEFTYDYLGRRVEKRVYVYASGWPALPAERMVFVYHGWLPLLEYKEVAGLLQTAKKMTWGLDLSQTIGGAGGIGGLLSCLDTAATSTTSDDRSLLYCYDGNGNVGQLVETTGGPGGAAYTGGPPGPAYGTLAARYEYDAYGNNLLDTTNASQSGTYAATNSCRFSTKPFDNETELEYWGYRYYMPTLGRWVSRDPAQELGSTNIYSYSLNNPINWVDALGLTPKLWTFSGVNNFDSTRNEYVDYVLETLHKMIGVGTVANKGQRDESIASENPLTNRSHCGAGDHYGSWDFFRDGSTSATDIASLFAEERMDNEAEHFANSAHSDGEFCKSCTDSSSKPPRKKIKVIMIAPKTDTLPPSKANACCNVSATVYWDSRDPVPNQQPGVPESNRFWSHWGTVHSVRSNPGVIDPLNLGVEYHSLSGFLIDKLPINDGTGNTNVYAPNPLEIIKSELADANNDYVMVCHSQGCNIAMHVLNRVCGQKTIPGTKDERSYYWKDLSRASSSP